MSNKGIDWLRLKALCLIMPKYMVLRLDMPTFKNIVQIEVSLTYGWSPSALVCLRPCCLIMPKNMVLCLYVPKRRDVVQTKLFMSNKGTGWLRLKALCLVTSMPKYMVLCLNIHETESQSQKFENISKYEECIEGKSRPKFGKVIQKSWFFDWIPFFWKFGLSEEWGRPRRARGPESEGVF